MDIIIDTVIEQATMEEMVDYVEMRDNIIEMVGDKLVDVYSQLGIEDIKRIVRTKLKVTI